MSEEMMNFYIYVFFTIIMFILAPFLGMLATGVGRKMSARMQHRYGPPILQPWYDVMKLLMKKDVSYNKLANVMAFGFLIFTVLAVVVLVMLLDILMVVILLGIGQLFISLTGYAGSSPYSHVGANRNLLQVLSVEPLLLIFAIGILIINGSFYVKDLAMNYSAPLYFPVALAVLIFAMLIWMQKGPFDLSSAHQEIIYGPLIELSGENLAYVEIGHWFENFAFLALFSLFFNVYPIVSAITGPILAAIIDIIVKVIVAFIALLIVVWIDNATARLHWDILPKFSYFVMLPIIAINLLLIYLHFKMGVI